MMSTQNDGQNSGRYFASNIVPTAIQFSPVNTPGMEKFFRKDLLKYFNLLLRTWSTFSGAM